MNSIELEIFVYIENFSSTKFDVNDRYKMLSNLKKFDILEKMIDSKKGTVTGYQTFANAFNTFFDFNVQRVRQFFQWFHW